MNRPDGFACERCMYWERHAPALSNEVRDPSAAPDTGACHYRDPTLVVDCGLAVSRWPVTHASRFCGNFEDAFFDSGGPGGGEVIPFERAA